MSRKTFIKGFTLIELLVVIAIIALLLAVILPSLKAAKELASAVVCGSDQKSLSTAWILYAEDYDNKIVGGSTYNGSNGTPYRWVEPPLIDPIYNSTRASTAQLSEQTRLNGIRAGRLFNYIDNVKVYHCPGDKTFTNAEPYAVYRSYAIAGLMNGEDFITRSGGIYGPITGYRSITLNGITMELKVATSTSQIRAPGNKYVFVEEDVVKGKSGTSKQAYNMGGFVLLNASNGYSWWDSPAGFHNGGSTLGFADGHAEKRKWQDRDTINLVEEAIPDPDPANNEDLIWLAKGYIPIP